MLCLDWLHKCMILCNPDLLSCFFPFWSISYFAFNHIGQTVGRLPGAVSQMVSLVPDPSAQVSLPPPHCFARACCVFFPLYPCSWTVSLCQETSCGRWWSSFWNTVSWFRQCVLLTNSLDFSRLTSGFSAGSTQLITLVLQLQTSLSFLRCLCEMIHLREVLWCSIALIQYRISDSFTSVILIGVLLINCTNAHLLWALFGPKVSRLSEQSDWEKLSNGKRQSWPLASH